MNSSHFNQHTCTSSWKQQIKAANHALTEAKQKYRVLYGNTNLAVTSAREIIKQTTNKAFLQEKTAHFLVGLSSQTFRETYTIFLKKVTYAPQSLIIAIFDIILIAGLKK